MLTRNIMRRGSGWALRVAVSVALRLLASTIPLDAAEQPLGTSFESALTAAGDHTAAAVGIAPSQKTI